MSSVKYHFNPNTGKSGVCSAEKRMCPLIHGDNEQDARINHEKAMSGSTVTVLRKRKRSVEDVFRDTPLKNLDAAQLGVALRLHAASADMDLVTVDSAITLASLLHSHQKRGNRGKYVTTPYIEHPLRNSIRLLRMGVTDQDIIVATILHDTVEDGSQVFVKKTMGTNIPEVESREILSAHIGDTYGQRARGLVEAVTNPVSTESSEASVQDKHRIYLDHVRANITGNPGAFMVKISDFIDNASGLYHNDIPGKEQRVAKQAAKYLPVVAVFEKAMNDMELPVPKRSVAMIRQQLKRTSIRLQQIIDKYAE